MAPWHAATDAGSSASELRGRINGASVTPARHECRHHDQAEHREGFAPSPETVFVDALIHGHGPAVQRVPRSLRRRAVAQ
jgi:hypothetical protein